jgi:dolichol-phosphate mannosyltransferase
MNDLLIFIPTYNERENVEGITQQILDLGLAADILFLDDNSPDGTGEILDQLAERIPNFKVIHRTGKLGIGSAHATGIQWAYDNDYQMLLTMDCDFTHSPSYIPNFIEKAQDADIVVGSRYLQEDSLETWNTYRRTLTKAGHAATNFLLDMPYDATGAFRLYRLDRISRYFVNAVHSRGYSFFFESLYVLKLNGHKIVEISTRLPARTYGHSKMRLTDAFKSLGQLFHTYFTTVFNRERFEIAEPFHPTSATGELFDPQDWNSYWASKGKPTLLVYDLIAAFYRKFIIRPLLNYFILKYFNGDSRLLHAGCGSGQVDKDIGEKIQISALDISPEALSIYRKSNKNYRELIHGSIFDMPIQSGSLDGIYNLGVMEHFTEAEVMQILREFYRTLKPGGYIILFWPPEFGASVMFLKFVHYVLNNVLKKNIMLHPPEITRVHTKRQTRGYLDQSGFEMKEYAFGPRDLFTYAVIVGQKIEIPAIVTEAKNVA